MTTSRLSFILTLTGLLIAAPAIHAANAGKDKSKGEQIELESFSWGLPKNNHSGAPNDMKAPGQKPPGQQLPTVQKARPALDKEKKEEKKPSYPAPGVETWQGKRFPPPAPAQPALKQK